MAKKFLSKDGTASLWNRMKEYVENNRFDVTRLEVDPETGHLIAQEGGNISFSVDSNGHLITEVT